MFHCASLKLGLERAVMSQNREQIDDADEPKAKKKVNKEAQAREIDELLKKGAYDVFRDDDDGENEKFMETDIDQLLAESSKKVTYGASSTNSLGSGLGSFSKASFVANTEDGAKDVDLDDPDFWAKAIGLEVPDEIPDDIAAMLDDGVKRSRKQVQVYNPYAETEEAEQKKREKIAIEKQLEKEEKEKMLSAKKKKKKDGKKRKDGDETEQLKRSENETLPRNGDDENEKDEKKIKIKMESKTKTGTSENAESNESKPKKQSKKIDKIKAMKRAENEDPAIERIKQAWETPHRARCTAAALRFGFGRFCKIRYESNLSSLPLQDIETFVSSYVYQLGLQFSVTLLTRQQDDRNFDDFQTLIEEWLATSCRKEVEWICDSVRSALIFQNEVYNYRRVLRMPIILNESSYVADLRHGAALRALRRIGLLARMNSIIEDELDAIISRLGHEELGKRGCGVGDVSSLDADLKARYVTTEELCLAIGRRIRFIDTVPPASWWDRSCDVGLIVGSFIHGLGSYEAMRNDLTLPFAEKIQNYGRNSLSCKVAMQNFRAAADAARRTFDNALESARVKAELEVQAAVAAAAKAALKREEDAALLRKGGVEAEVAAKNMPETQVENAFEFDGTDSHFVTLSRMQEDIHRALSKTAGSSLAVETAAEPTKFDEEAEYNDDGATSTLRVKHNLLLPLPDSRVLDHQLIRLLEAIELDDLHVSSEQCKAIPRARALSPGVGDCIEIRSKIASVFSNSKDTINEYIGIGLSSNQCGTSHRSLNDGSDFSFGAANSQLSQVAYGTDAPRYLRAIGVPMNVTRFAVSALCYALCVEKHLQNEKERYYGDACPDKRRQKGNNIDPETLQEPDVAKHEEDNSSEKTDLVQESLTAAANSSESGIANSSAKIVYDLSENIDEAFRKNSKLRAATCLAVAYYGCPLHSSEDDVHIRQQLWHALQSKSRTTKVDDPPTLFSIHRFKEVAQSFIPDVAVPDASTLKNYVESVLLPHCLRLCINGNGPVTRTARGSNGEYETAIGVSFHPEPSQNLGTPVPDPCMSLQEHTLESLGLANAVLRRVRLLKTCQWLCSEENVSPGLLKTLARSNITSKAEDMPMWWSPFYDIALITEASSGGLFSVISEREDHPIFSSATIMKRYLSSASNEFGTQDQLRLWLADETKSFPSINQLERRLAVLCSVGTSEIQGDYRFHCLPMFDHGAWPRC